MYTTLVAAHSILRWLVLVLLVVAVAQAVVGWLTRRPVTGMARGLSSGAVGALDLQVLLGVVLWVMGRRWTTFGAMDVPELRFYAVEHLGLAVLALAAAHVGNARARRATTPERRYRNVTLGLGFALLAVLALIPWPFLPHGRPLWPG